MENVFKHKKFTKSKMLTFRMKSNPKTFRQNIAPGVAGAHQSSVASWALNRRDIPIELSTKISSSFELLRPLIRNNALSGSTKCELFYIRIRIQLEGLTQLIDGMSEHEHFQHDNTIFCISGS